MTGSTLTILAKIPEGKSLLLILSNRGMITQASTTSRTAITQKKREDLPDEPQRVADKAIAAKEREGYRCILKNARLRQGAADGIFGSKDLGRSIALLASGRMLSDVAIQNYVAPMLKTMSRAGDAVTFLQVMESSGACKANIEAIRGLISNTGWDEIDGDASSYLRPPEQAPLAGPWAW